ncbi:hypothetical protein AMELA_G00202860, partial [Ameiurus melas]
RDSLPARLTTARARSLSGVSHALHSRAPRLLYLFLDFSIFTASRSRNRRERTHIAGSMRTRGGFEERL